jgi:hypothetical protein
MATWGTITLTGGQTWVLWGGGITNHEVFAFTLQSSETNVGAYISNVTVFDSNTEAGNNSPAYYITVQAMQFDPNNWALTPVNQGITGNFESNGV